MPPKQMSPREAATTRETRSSAAKAARVTRSRTAKNPSLAGKFEELDEFGEPRNLATRKPSSGLSSNRKRHYQNSYSEQRRNATRATATRKEESRPSKSTDSELHHETTTSGTGHIGIANANINEELHAIYKKTYKDKQTQTTEDRSASTASTQEISMLDAATNGSPWTPHVTSLKRKQSATDPSIDIASECPPTKLPQLDTNWPQPTQSRRQFGSLEALHQAGWEMADLPQNIGCSDSLDLSRVPSPFAKSADRHSYTIHNLETHVNRRLSPLLRYILKAPAQAKARVLQRFSSPGDGDYGIFCMLRGVTRSNHDANDVEGEGSCSEMELRKLSTATCDLDIPLHVRLAKNCNTGKFGLFIVNQCQDRLVVNESMIGPYLVVGPLPDFAIIEADHYALLWFSSPADLDYVPCSGLQSIAQTSAGKELPSPSMWEGLLSKGLANHRANHRQSRNPEKEPFEIEQYAGMEVEDVILGVAPIWDARRREGILHAYGGRDIFERGDGGGHLLAGWSGVVGKRNKFIMPLFFQSDKVGKLGHFVLGVAEMGSSNNSVRIDICDSFPGYIGQSKIETEALQVVRSSKWAQNEANIELRIRFNNVPTQPLGSNACGLFVILNAWATILSIPIHKSTCRRECGRPGRSDDEFLKLGLEIVNLALAGCMDSQTIQAFMNVFGYSRPQNPNDQDDLVNNIPATWIDECTFKDILRQQRESEGSEERNVAVSQEDIRRVLAVSEESTADEAKHALIQENGDRDRAVQRLLGLLDEP